MSMIPCPECKKEISDQAVACPNCGYSLNKPPVASLSQEIGTKKVSFLLGLGIFFIPYIFSWVTLKNGYSKTSRTIALIWMIIVLLWIFVPLISSLNNIFVKQ